MPSTSGSATPPCYTLLRHDGKAVHVRFRLQTDSSGNREGVSLSNIRVRSALNGAKQEHALESLSAAPLAESLLALATDEVGDDAVVIGGIKVPVRDNA
jgi:hypothetical protein